MGAYEHGHGHVHMMHGYLRLGSSMILNYMHKCNGP